MPFRLIVDVWFRFLGDTFGTVPVGGRHLFRFLADTSGSVFGLVLSTRQRARLHLAEGLRVHVERLSSRAMSRSFRGHPSAVRRLGVDVRVVAGGLSGAGDVDADLVVADRSEVYVRSGDVDADLVVADRSEVYVRSGDVAVLVAEYGLEPSPMGEGNVVLRVLSEVWPFEEGERVAPALVDALDLLESSDERTQRAGRLLFDRVLREASR